MCLTLPSMATANERMGISDLLAAIIASSFLQYVNLVSYKNITNVIDKSKIRRQWKKVRLKFQIEVSNSKKEIQGIFFDGRKDKTSIVEKKGNQLHRVIKTEEHSVLLAEFIYFGHTIPSSGMSSNIMKIIKKFCRILIKETLIPQNC